MKIDCSITELLQRDFNTLWKCQQHGETLEISTPYLLPDSTLLSLMLKVVNNRCIVCEGGAVWETILEYGTLPTEEITPALQEMARKFGIKEGEIRGNPLFFKECEDLKLVSSLAFDIANFAVMATSALVSVSSDDLVGDVEHRFDTKAEKFVRSVAPSGYSVSTHIEMPQVPGVKFSAVVEQSSRLWLISFINGSTFTHFRRCLVDGLYNFKHAKESSLSQVLLGTIPLVNNESPAYQPNKLVLHLEDLKRESDDKIVNWTERDRLRDLLRS